MDGVLCVEHYGSKTHGSPVIYSNDRLSGKIIANKRSTGATSLVQFLKTIFLPQGYPDSVSEDYFEYQVWDTMQAFCSSITGSLATQAVLKGSGVGDETANVAGAAITWLLKDGTGMVGRIAFAYYKGVNLDCDAKKWRLFADVLNDIAIFVQLIAPMWPKAYFTFIMCLAGLAFSLVGVAGGCTRAALTMHQAKRDNMADVSAKDGSQETLVNLTALVINLFLTPIVSDNLRLTWILFIIFTFLHIYTNYRAVSCIVMDTLNVSRLRIVVQHWFNNPGNIILDPKEANAREPILPYRAPFILNLGCPLNLVYTVSSDFTEKLQKNPQVQFLIKIDFKKGACWVALRDTVTAEDVIRACCIAETSWMTRDKDAQFNVDAFVAQLKMKSWDLSRNLLCADEWRWSTDHLDKIK